MKRLAIRKIVAGTAVLAAAACAGDPTESLRTGPSNFSLRPDQMFVDSGTTRGFEVIVRDAQLNPVAASVTLTSTNPNIFTVGPDTAAPSGDGARYNFVVTARAPGEARLVVTSSGIADTATITVLLPALPLTISDTVPRAGQTITVRASPTHKFTAATEVLFGGDDSIPGLRHRVTADSVVVVAPFGSSAGVLTITNVNVLYHAGLVQDLPTTRRVRVTGDLWPAGDTSYATAPNLFTVLPLPAVGDSVHTITNLGPNNFTHCAEYGPAGPPNFSTGPCVIYKFTVAGPDSLNLLLRVDWDNDADIDVYACDGTGFAGCFESGGTAASGRKPEYLQNPLVGGVRTPTAFKYPPGDHYFVLELFDGDKPDNMYVTIYRK